MAHVGHALATRPFAPIEVRVVGPDSATAPAMDRRLGGRHARRRPRLQSLANATRVIARVGSRPVGVAAYERCGPELRVLDMAIRPVPPYGTPDVLRHLLHALEVAALAGGCDRMVLMPPAVVASTGLARHGYRVTADGGATGWVEKIFTS